MAKQIIAIGGGGFGRSPGEGIIEKYIINQSKIKKPKICFIPTATGDDDAYKVNFYSTFSKLNSEPCHLDFFKRTPNIEDLISAQDIVFVGGGNTKSMLAVWKDWGLVKILKDAYDKGTIMCGVSAGAICWFENGITDSWESELKIINCLSFVSGNCCPHYDEEPQRRPALKKYLQNRDLDDCYAIEGGCALHLIDGEPHKCIAFKKTRNTYCVKVENNKIVEEPFFREEIL